MSVFSALVIAGTIISMEGPLPYDLNECNERAGINEWRMDLMFQTPEVLSRLRQKFPNVKRYQVHNICVDTSRPLAE